MLTELYLIILLLINSFTASIKKNDNQNYSFEIDYENDQFLLDGKPFRFIAGSFHYFRVPKQYWKNIFRKMRAAGLNTATTYVEWSTHEPEPNEWIWDGNANIIEFIEAAQEEDLLVILRPGPYICGERDFGGFPYWLLSLVPDIELRTKDERYMFFVERYLNEILIRVKPLLRANGGPIIMVQIENEYGSLEKCDDEYKRKLYEIFNRHVGKDAVLYTVDGMSLDKLQCGTIPGVFQTVDFAPTQSIKHNFEMMRNITPKGPLVNPEFYTGWLSHWNEPYREILTSQVILMLDKLLALNASFNFYMFYGGTNYGFTSGSNANDESFNPQLTSYDYNAPLNEAGDPTPKYFEIRRTISKYLPLPNLKIPPPNLKRNYGTISMLPVLDLFTEESRVTFGNSKDGFTEPPTFEALRVPHWLVLYEADLTSFSMPKNINLTATVKDRALIYINDKFSGILSREARNDTLLLSVNEIKSAKLLVENQGRINFGKFCIEDFKGISNVKLNNVTVSPWKVTSFKLSSITDESFIVKKTNKKTGTLYDGPQFLVGYFEIKDEPFDTFLNTSNWGKGVAYVNGHNLGRYWPMVGPQITLYIPAPFLKKGKNCLVLLELENIPETRIIQFQVEPLIDCLRKNSFKHETLYK